MVTVKASVVVHRPIEEVYQFIATDYFQNRSKWSKHNSRFNFENATGGTMRKDLTLKQTSTNRSGKQVETTLKVTEYVPNKKLTFRLSSKFADVEETQGKSSKMISTEAESTLFFEQIEGGTKVSGISKTWFEGASTYANVYWTVVMLLSRGKSLRISKDNLDSILDLMEGPKRIRSIRRSIRRVWSWWYAYALVFLILFWVNTQREQLQLTAGTTAVLQMVLSLMAVLAIGMFWLRSSFAFGLELVSKNQQ